MATASLRRQENGYVKGFTRARAIANVNDPNALRKADFDDDSLLVWVPEPGTYRVRWDLNTNRFVLVPVDLDF